MKSNIFGDKRGSIMDPILSSAYLLKVVVTIILCLVIWAAFNDLMTELITGTEKETVIAPVLSTLTSAYQSFDYMFPFLVGGLMIISLLFAFKTGANYVWGIMSLLVWGLTVLLATVITNVYIAITNKFPSFYVDNPIMDVVMMNIRWVALLWVAVISAVMFRKDNKEDEVSEIQRRAYVSK